MITYQEFRDAIGENGEEGIQRYRKRVSRMFRLYLIFTVCAWIFGVIMAVFLLIKLLVL